ncbi:MAG: MBL fold metallo-hydrolase [Ilumatobacter sp.]|nr:MBL fold metallo-hydrolase [Ilumatobacter sp.]
MHRIGRRQFLTELGRRTFAIAIVGGVAACSSDDDDDGASPAAGAPDTPADTAPASNAETTTRPSAATTTATTDGTVAPTTAANDDEAGLRWAQASLGFVSAYVLVRGNEAAVVDTGSAGSADQIGAALGTLGATYDDVRHVVLTHHHPDHVGSLPVVLDRATGSTAYAGEADIPNITSASELVAVGDGDDVFGLRVLHTPGHTPGSISLYDPGIGLLVAGDALNGNDSGSGLSGANAQFSSDMAAANTSVAKLAELDVEAVAMGHGQPVGSGAGALLTALAAEL